MPRGGARPGAGRKKGTKGKETVEKLERAKAALARGKAAGMLPLDILLDRMRANYDAGKFEESVACAVKAAPYCHPRLESMTAKVTVRRAEQMTDEELEAELQEMGVDVGAARAVQGRTTH